MSQPTRIGLLAGSDIADAGQKSTVPLWRHPLERSSSKHGTGFAMGSDEVGVVGSKPALVMTGCLTQVAGTKRCHMKVKYSHYPRTTSNTSLARWNRRSLGQGTLSFLLITAIHSPTNHWSRDPWICQTRMLYVHSHLFLKALARKMKAMKNRRLVTLVIFQHFLRVREQDLSNTYDFTFALFLPSAVSVFI